MRKHVQNGCMFAHFLFLSKFPGNHCPARLSRVMLNLKHAANSIAPLVMEGLASSLPESLLEAVEARGVMARWVARDTTSKRYFDITTDSVCISTNKFAALLAAICARIGSRKAKSKAGEIPPFFVSPVVVWGMEVSAYAGA